MTLQVALSLGAAARSGGRSAIAAMRTTASSSRCFFACSLAALPYVLVYDTLPLCVAAMALFAGGALDARGRLLARLVFWLPLLQIGLAVSPSPARR